MNPDSIGQAIQWATVHADILKVSAGIILATIAVSVGAVRTRTLPASRRLLMLSVGATTGLSADGMWEVSGTALHLDGAVRVAFFAFGEITLLSAAAMVGESLKDLRLLLSEPPDSDASVDDKAVHEALKAAATRKARQFTALVWVIAVGIGIAGASVADNPTARGVRLVPALIVAWLWYAQLDRSGLVVAREKITSRLSWRRLMVLLRIADPGTIGLGEVDRNRRLDRLADALYRYNMAKDRSSRWLPAYDWRVTRAERSARRQHDDEGRQYVARQLSARYTLRTGTSPEALSGLSPWTVTVDSVKRTELSTPTVRKSGQVIEGSVVDCPAAQDSRTAAGQSGRTADSARTVVRMAPHRPSGQSVEDMAAWLSAWMDSQSADRVPGRPTVLPLLREQFGTCSTEQGRMVLQALRELRSQGQSTTEDPTAQAVNE